MGVNWTTDQRHAIECRKGSVLVSAAAGSGKTSSALSAVLRTKITPVRRRIC